MTSRDPDALIALAHRLAGAGGRAALQHFRAGGLASDNKDTEGGFDPVTVADRAAERAIREILAQERPEDAVIGEEEAARAGTSGLSWVIDPIDGTRSFISGLPLWGVLVALDDGSEGRIGVIEQPFTGERFSGSTWTGRAALYRNGEEHPIAVRPCAALAEATLFSTDPDHFPTAGDVARFRSLRSAARLTRYGTDSYAYALLAIGQVDLVVEAGLKSFDIAAPAALIRAAGGLVTDWQGGDPRWGGHVIAASDARVHAEALALLNR